MHSHRSLRLLVVVLSVCGAAAFAALAAAQSGDAPGDPLIAGFKSTIRRRCPTRSSSSPEGTGRCAMT